MAVLGNMIPVVPLLLFLDPVSNGLRHRIGLADRFFEWLFARTRRKTEAGLRKYGVFFGLMIFVAIPLPVTGKISILASGCPGRCPDRGYNCQYSNYLAAMVIKSVH